MNTFIKHARKLTLLHLVSIFAAATLSAAESQNPDNKDSAPKTLKIYCAAQSANIFRSYASDLISRGGYYKISIESADFETIEGVFTKGSVRIAVSDKPIQSAKVKSTPIAVKGSLFAVNLSNPIVNLSSDQIKEILDSKISSWAKLGGDSEPLRLYKTGVKDTAPIEKRCTSCDESDSEHDHEKTKKKKEINKNQVMVFNSPDTGKTLSLVAADRSAFAPVNLTAFDSKTVKLLSVDNIAPTSENLRLAKYPFATILYLIESTTLTLEESKLSEYTKTKAFALEIYREGMLPMKIENTQEKAK